MEQEINEIIKKNLPAHVGDVLKQRLEKADEDAKKVADLEGLQKALVAKIDALNNEVSTYMMLDERNKGLEQREKAVAEKERSLEIEALKTQLEAEKDKSDFAKNVALGLVRNVEYRSETFNSKSGPNGRDQYGNPMYDTHSVSATEEKKVS